MTEENCATMTDTDFTERTAEPIAVVGMAVRLPGARTPEELWQNLLAGAEASREFTPGELGASGVPQELRSRPGYVTRGVALEDVDRFDAEFFGFTPQEARVTDPQQRIFLETAWRALEDAGIAPHDHAGPVGVFASTSMSTYLLHNILQSTEESNTGDLSYPVLIGNDKDFLATRVSYKLGLTGPSHTIQSACSSSLVALHQASASLTRGESDVALAGGVSVTVPQTTGYLHKEGGIASPDGHCRPFDQEAAGTIRGNGAGVVVLKRLADARAQGDRIYAVLSGSAVNNDGDDKIGFTAPGVQGQTRVVTAALAAAGVRSEEIGYVETHGTGTALGDPIEVRALSKAHGADSPCALGSVKANLGHLDAAAGVVGFIKTALILHRQILPPQINFSVPNIRIPMERSRFIVHTDKHIPAEPLTAAGVSSFGIGGTNAHAVLTRADDEERPRPAADTRFLVTLSAKSPEALRQMAGELHTHLCTELPRLDDLAFTLARGRERFAHRFAVEATAVEEVTAALNGLLEQGTAAHGGDQAEAYVDGQALAEEAFGPLSTARTVSLPAYPFAAERYWIDPVTAPETAPAPTQEWAAGPGTSLAEVEAEVIEVLGKVLGVEEIDSDSDFFDLGGDSLAAVDAIAMLGEKYPAELEMDEFADLRTPRALGERLVALIDGTTSKWSGMVRIREGEGQHLFLLYPAGGTNFCYFRLAEHIRYDGPLTAFAYPQEFGDGPVTIRQLAALYVQQMREVQPKGPYVLAGYSFGGNLAFEVAQRLQQEGQEVAGLYLFDAHPPEAYVGEKLSEDEFLRAFPQMLASMLPDSTIPDEISNARTVEEAVDIAFRNRPEWLATNESEFLRFVHIWRRNHEALKGYYPDGRVQGRVVVFAAEDSHPEEEVALLRIKLLDKEYWRSHIDGDLHEVAVPGNHYTMFTEKDLMPHLATAFQVELDALAARNGRAAEQP